MIQKMKMKFIQTGSVPMEMSIVQKGSGDGQVLKNQKQKKRKRKGQ